MAGKPVSIEFIADVAQYLRETKKVAVSTEDIADALVSVSEDAADLERKLSRAMKDSAGDVETLERAVKDIPKATDNMADQSARDFERFGDEAGEAGREASEELKQNLGQTLGSGGSIADMATETAGALVGSLQGAAGLAFGGLAAVALIAFNSIKKSWEETTQAITDQTESMWSSALGSLQGAIGSAAIEITNAALSAKELDRLWTENRDEMVGLVDAAKDLGINVNDVVRARAGDEAALKKVKTAMDTIYETQNATGEATVDQIKGVQTLETALYKADEAQETINAHVDAYNDSLGLAGIQADILKGKLDRLPKDLVLRVKVDDKSLGQFSGGAYATTGGASGGAVYRAKAG